MSDFKHLTRIDAYLEGQLNAIDKAQFEQDLLQDTTLKKEYDACLASDEALKVIAFKGMMEQIKKEEVIVERPSFSIQSIFAIAAAILLLLVAGSFLFANLNYSNQQLVTTTYREAKPTFSGQRDDATTLTNLQLIQLAFQNNDFEKVQSLGENIAENDTHFLEYQLILGCTALQNNQHEVAINKLSIVARTTNVRQERAEFLLALAYLKSNKLELAQKEIGVILANSDHAYSKEAKQLYTQMNSFWRKWII